LPLVYYPSLDQLEIAGSAGQPLIPKFIDFSRNHAMFHMVFGGFALSRLIHKL